MRVPTIKELFILITALAAEVISCYIVFIGILLLNFIYIIIAIVLIWTNFKGILAILKQQQRSLKIYVFGNIMLIVLSFVIWSSVRDPGKFTLSDLYVIIPVLILSISIYCAVTIKLYISPQLERTPTPPIEDRSTTIRPPKYEDIPIAATYYDDLPPPYTITALAMPTQNTPTLTTTSPITNTQLNLGVTTHTQEPLQQVNVIQIVQQQSAPVNISDGNRDNNEGNNLNGYANTANTTNTANITTTTTQEISNDVQ